MVARFTFECAACGGRSLQATGFANDFPDPDASAAWAFRLEFHCSDCGRETASVVLDADGATRLTMDGLSDGRRR